MTYKEYKIAVVGFYQINDSYNGASEVSLSLYDSLNCKKKLFTRIEHLKKQTLL